MKNVLFSLIALVLFTSISFAKNFIEKDGLKYLPNKIVVKFVDETAAAAFNEQTLLKGLKSTNPISIKSMKQKFVAAKKTAERFNLIQEIEINGPHDPLYLSAKLSKLPTVEWAEPVFIYDLAFTPNDPSFSQQYALQRVEAEAAWDVTKGNENVVIAIVDTGVDWDHPDLFANIWVNQPEANGAQGVDDDNNGKIDDYHGWDFGGLNGVPDNNPMEDRPDHGTHVAGIVSAATNNAIGVAGIGFNCKIMAVKTSRDDVRNNFGTALISNGYEGIIYAVDMGADIVNCSWGGYGFSQAAQEVINYAVANGVTVIGAAGNEGRRDAIYPGKYNGALSVGYTNSTDRKDGASNYGEYVDLFAPGSGILNTWQDDTYISIGGSSMAAPMVAGIAGLVKSVFPNYTPLQVAEQVRVNADNVEAENPGLPLLMGAGRANAFKAVSNTNSKSVRATEVKFIDMGDGDGIFESGEQVDVEINFTNYLSPTTNLNVELVSTSNQLSLTNSSIGFGALATLQDFNNVSNKFSFTINQNAPDAIDVRFRLDYSDASYSDFQWTNEITINPLYKTTTVNDISVTITSDGKLGFNDYPNNFQGDGFKFQDGGNILFEGGLLYGNSASKVVSSVRSSNQQVSSDEFASIDPLIFSSPGAIADEQGFTRFSDADAGSKRLNIETEMTTYSFAGSDEDDFIILEYKFNNTTGQNIDNFYAGLFFDWDIDETHYDSNIGTYDESGQFGYIVNNNLNDVSTHVGMALLTEGNVGFYTIDNPDMIYDGFTDSEKWTTLTSGSSNATGGPDDISSVNSVGPLSIPANGNIKVAFSVSAAETMEDLRDAVNRSRNKFNEIVTDVEEESTVPLTFSLVQNYPNPFNPTTTIEYTIPQLVETQQAVTLRIFDILGREVVTLVNQNKKPGRYKVNFDATRLSSGVYYYTLRAGSFISTKKMLLLK
jgi:serine protease